VSTIPGAVPDGQEPAWVADVLRFWFEEATPRQWFLRDDDFDAAIRVRFAALHARLAAGGLAPDPGSVRAMLAAVVVLDQFSRNLHRGGALAFANDARARVLAGEALARGQDEALPPSARLFLYLPFEHSESLADQDRAVALVGALGDPQWTHYARAHRDVIARFGRFPHRNAVLGRESTPEEQEALARPGNAF
jgi:uncharacterized protein (DUF924 family)